MEQQPRPLFGRERELAESAAALARLASGAPQTLLVAGEAGIGKTSLVEHIGAQARGQGFDVAFGHCLDIATGALLGPVYESLRSLLGRRTAKLLPPVSRRLAPYLRGQEIPDTEVAARLLGDLQLVVGELAREQPVMLVLEDMHWADRSTQDFAASLARSAPDGLLLVLTFRSEELARGHRFRTTAIDVARSPGATRMDLERLDRRAIAGIIRTATGAVDPELLDDLMTRSEGNPLFAEELLAGKERRVSTHLSDLLLARIGALSPLTQELLRLASVDGSEIDSELLQRASGRKRSEVELSLHEALDANVVALRSGRLAFRHGLIREALYDNLLPRERERAHADLAQAIEALAQPDGVADGDIATLRHLAYHWTRTADDGRALEVSSRAGVAAFRYGRTESATELLQQAAELGTRVGEPKDPSAPRRADVLGLLAERRQNEEDFAAAATAMTRALDLIAGGRDAALTSRVYASYGMLSSDLPGRITRHAALDRAIALVSDAPCQELVEALTRMGRWHGRQGNSDLAVDFCRRALDVAERIEGPGSRGEATYALSARLFRQGKWDEASALMARAVELAHQAGQIGHEMLFLANQAAYLMYEGEFERSVQVAQHGMEQSLASGLPDMAALNGEQIVDVRRLQGDFDLAEELLQRLREEMVYRESRWLVGRAELLLARGDLTGAGALVAAIARSRPHGDNAHEDALLEVAVSTGTGDVATALTVVYECLTEVVSSDSRLDVGLAVEMAYLALAGAAAAGVEVEPELTSRADDLLRRALAWLDGGWSRTTVAAGVLYAAAVARDLADQTGVQEWRLAEEAGARLGRYSALRPRLGLARALLGDGQRDEGRALLTEVWQSSHEMGAAWFESEAVRVARKSRVALPGLKKLAAPLAALTPREREVLEVLVTGATNRDIARRLFISEKTVSVHVTNLMAKLGVSNRGAAAALARDLAQY